MLEPSAESWLRVLDHLLEVVQDDEAAVSSLDGVTELRERVATERHVESCRHGASNAIDTASL